VGTVVIAPRQVVHSDVKGPLPPVLGRMPEGQSP
jgi:hypothetical protein